MSGELLPALSMLLTMISLALQLIGDPQARRGKAGLARAIPLVGAAVVFALAVYQLAAS